MAEGSPPNRKQAQNDAPPDAIDESNIADAEDEAVERASRAISILEDALAKWDASKDKSEEWQGQANGYRRLLEEFSGWVKKMLLAKGRRDDFKSRISRLNEFIAICREYERGE